MSPDPSRAVLMDTVLMNPGELADRLALDAGARDRLLVLADVRWNLSGPPGRPEYEVGHLPGAAWVDLTAELSGPPGAGGRHPLPPVEVFEAAMRRIGVRADSEVVVYDGRTSLSAARLWWLLLDAGHPRVRVLDGGFAAWQRAGLPVQTGPEPEHEAGDFVARPGHLERVGTDELAAQVGTTAAPALVDVRAPERYRGEVEPIDPVAGHIPGAVNRPSMANLDADGRFRPAVVAEHYADLPDPVLYCGSGITAAHSLLALRSAGLIGGRIYPGSWSDWVRDPGRPVATGPG
jgi:thiosulfate/3-mercaptopyruvate sulfurtransferase